MKQFFILLFFIPQFEKTVCQTVELKPLLKAYNSKSLVSALNNLEEISTFKGKLYPGIDLSDSSVRGTIGIDSIRARKQNGKIAIYSIFHEVKEFEYIKKQANKSLYAQEINNKESSGVYREHYVFSNVSKMKKGDLQFIITRSTSLDGKRVYYQLDLIVYD